MLDMTLEQGHHIFLNALTGNNFSNESIRAYSLEERTCLVGHSMMPGSEWAAAHNAHGRHPELLN